MGKISKPQVGNLFQLAYVVRDLVRAEDFFKRTLGVPHFFNFELELAPPDLRVRGKPASCRLLTGLGYFGDTQLEVIQTLSADNIYTEFLERHGAGLHHVGLITAEYDRTVELFRGQGFGVLSDGHLEKGMIVNFTYFDCELAGASIVEILSIDERCHRLFERIKSGDVKNA